MCKFKEAMYCPLITTEGFPEIEEIEDNDNFNRLSENLIFLRGSIC